ncbi:MAG: AAC(3) family N-acetyltransferase [Chloroflexi bacterium]|nr:AAC(3) family N-acetyltransferase [Chloroflexota bacterium]
MTVSPQADLSHVTPADLARALVDLGIGTGMGLMVHSSLSSFGNLVGGAPTLIEGLMAAVGPQGTIMMPSFNHGAAFRPGAPGYYDPRETPTRNGLVPDTFWRLPGVRRSLDPTHPFAAWGVQAERYISGHHRTLTMGPDSPLGLLGREGGYGLLVGVGFRSNSYHHVAETTNHAPCLGRRTEAHPVHLPDGRTVLGRTCGWRSARCPFTDEQRYPAIIEGRRLARRVRVGGSELTLFRLSDCAEVVLEMLRSGADGYPPCARCPIRPRHNEYTVPSDWDDEREALRPDSEAWTY